MKKIITKGRDKINKISKRIAEESPNTVSTFLYYEPKMPRSIIKKVEFKN